MKISIYFYSFFKNHVNLLFFLLLLLLNLVINISFKFILQYPNFFIFVFPSFLGIVWTSIFYKNLTSNGIFRNLINKNKISYVWLILLANFYLINFLFLLINYLIFYNYFFAFDLSLNLLLKNNIYFLSLSSLFILPISYMLIAFLLVIFVKNTRLLVLFALTIFCFNVVFNSTLFPIYLFVNHELFGLVYIFRLFSYINPSSYPLSLYSQIQFYAPESGTSAYSSFENHYFFNVLNDNQAKNIGVTSIYELIIRILISYMIIPLPYALIFTLKANKRFSLW